MPVLVIVGPKCTSAASHAAPGEYADGQTDGHQTVTLRFPL